MIRAVGAAADPRPLVAHVVHRFAVGGLENGVVNLINRMPAERWRHAVVALTEVDPDFVRRLQLDDVRCISLHKPPGQTLLQAPKLVRLFRELKPAVVHTRNLAANEVQLPAWWAGVPARVHSEHGRDIDDVHGTNRRHIWLRRACRPFVGHYIALSRDLADYLRGPIGVPAQRLAQIYNGVDSERFTPAAQRQPIAGSPFNDPALWLIGTVGRMQSVKAQTLLAEAFIAALQQRPSLRDKLRLVLVGEGPLRAECRRLLGDAGLGDLVWLPGERSDVADVMRGLNCFALPSLVEGISNTILEAMASGLPVLATDVGGNADLVVHGVSGEIVPASDLPAMAAAILAMAERPERALAMGRAGRLEVDRRFSLPAMVSAYEAVYDRLLQRCA